MLRRFCSRAYEVSLACCYRGFDSSCHASTSWTFAIPNLLRSKIAANQASAVGSLRTLNTACIAYSTSYNQFPGALSNLGPIASGGTASSKSADLIDSVLSAGTKSGYTFKYTAGSLNQSYTITATPITAATTGQNMYYTDQSGVIRVDVSGSGASSASTPIG